MAVQLWQVSVLMAVCVAALVVAEPGGHLRARATLKVVASLVFVAAGAALLPLSTSAGAFMLAGLFSSMLGDVLLIPKGNKALFLVGLGAFLAAHVAYAAAFLAHGISSYAALLGAAALVAVGVPLSWWLAAHVKGSMRLPVAGYVVTITAMVALAVGANGAGARVTLLVGAVLFYLSDLCVARERFVSRSRWNGAVGLPLYYAAQLSLIDGLR